MIFFASFFLASRFFATKSGIKKALMMSTRTCGLKLMPEIIFPKKELQMRDFESFIFWFKFRFMGDCFRAF